MGDQEEVKVLDTILRAIVRKPADLKIDRKVDERGILLTIWLGEGDAPLIIGKQGNTINKIRAVMGVVGAAQNKRIGLQVGDKKPESADPLSSGV